MRIVATLLFLLVLWQAAPVPVEAGRYYDRPDYYDRRYDHDDYRRERDYLREERYRRRSYGGYGYGGYGYGYCCEEPYGWGRTRPEQGTEFSDKDFHWKSTR